MISLKKVETAGEFETVIPFIVEGNRYNPFVSVSDLAAQADAGRILFEAIVFDERIIGGAAIEILNHPISGQHLNVVALGTEYGAYGYREHILSALEALAKQLGCTRLIASGRVGWIKLAKERGYETREFVVLWKDLE